MFLDLLKDLTKEYNIVNNGNIELSFNEQRNQYQIHDNDNIIYCKTNDIEILSKLLNLHDFYLEWMEHLYHLSLQG